MNYLWLGALQGRAIGQGIPPPGEILMKKTLKYEQKKEVEF